MAKLTARARKALPSSDFAGPNRSYPDENKSHAANAKARASQAVNAGRMSAGTEAKIDAKANQVLGKKGTLKARPRSGAKDGMGHGRGGLAVHSSARGTNMDSDQLMHRERY